MPKIKKKNKQLEMFVKLKKKFLKIVLPKKTRIYIPEN
jgi:hypothetical protein